MENLNLVELLRNCPTGMELDCTVFDNVTFDYVNTQQNRVYCKVNKSESVWFTAKGGVNNHPDAKCVIFPKGKTTWEGFQRPFKDGDVLSYQCNGYKERTIYIYMYHNRMNTTYHVALSGHSSEFLTNRVKGHALNSYNDTARFATEEEKQKLFDAIKANGFKWNAETKTLEKLVEPKFKAGDRVKRKDVNYTYIVTIAKLDGDYYDYVNEDGQCGVIYISKQDDWELVHDKFDINTLKPFDKVLGRDKNTDKWLANFWGFYDINNAINYPYECCGNSFAQCIPYEGNKHLLGTTNDCDDFYKTW